MLEETLRNDQLNPADAATALLAFVQVELPAGGSAAEQRFFRLYPFISDRIFGRILDAKNQFKHDQGGWMSATSPWKSTMTQGHASPRGIPESLAHPTLNSATAALERDPVVKLLGSTISMQSKKDEPIPQTLIEAISKESENCPKAGFRIPFHALPESIQRAWINLLEKNMGGNPANIASGDNTTILLGTLLQRKPFEQYELRNFHAKSLARKEDQRIPLQLTPRGFTIQSPISPSHKKPSESDDDTPHVMLSMLEHYLFLFLRYPFAVPLPKKTTTIAAKTSSNVSRTREAYGESVYNFLFKRYCRHFLPLTENENRCITISPSTRESELFLRSVVAFWLEATYKVVETSKVIDTILERRRRIGQTQAPNFGLELSYDLIDAKYNPPPMLVQKCFRSLISYIILDPSLRWYVEERRGLTPAMSILQLPFYNMIRTTFRHASVHSPSSPFISALECWLMWIEPWNNQNSKTFSPNKRFSGANGTERTARTIIIPKATSPSKYDPSWEPYIASNLHLYAVPLAIFLRRSRELDFYATKFNTSTTLLKRVFRVFTPEVVDVISRLFDGASDLVRLVRQHEIMLAEYAPPSAHLSVSSYGEDVRILLEEIYMQHTKKVHDLDIFERVGAKLEGLFGQGVVSGEEKVLHEIMERAKVIARLPVDYQLSTRVARSINSDNTLSKVKVAMRNKDGTLTSHGRALIMNGAVKCNPADIEYIGDRMKARVGSHEIPFLVDVAVSVSDRLNSMYGLGKNIRMRINLRFLADYRNLLFITILLYTLFKIIS